MLTVGIFGFYYKTVYGEAVRSRIIVKALKTISDMNIVGIRSEYPNNRCRFLKSQVKMFKKGIDFLRNVDLILVEYPAWDAVYIAKLISKLRHKPIIVDAFVSLYDTEVFDRRRVKENSLKALHLYLKDKLLCQLADHVLLDTREHIKYFSKVFHIPQKKFSPIYVGSDDEVFYPREKKGENFFLVTFHGTFIPLHGIEHIIIAMKFLEKHSDIKCEILGYGQTYKYVREIARSMKLKNTVLHRYFLKYEELPSFIAKADVCLGIFGNTPKAKRVVPTKVYDILAMKKPLITSATPAIREIGIINRKHALLVKPGDPKALADAILELKEDESLRERIAENGYSLYKKKFTPKAIGKSLKKVIEYII